MSPKSRDKRQNLIVRTKSEAALPSSARNALFGHRPEASLQHILDYLTSDALRYPGHHVVKHRRPLQHARHACQVHNLDQVSRGL